MLIIGDTEQIEIEVPDFEASGTTLKRKAKLFTLTYNQKAKYLSLVWIVNYFSKNVDGSYGDLISAQGINEYTRESVADNSTMVNAQTGQILIPDGNGNYDEQIDRIGQYDFFNSLAKAQPVQVHDLIRQYGQAVNWNL